MSGTPYSDSDRPFRFGVEMMAPFAGMSWADSARELEALGYSALHAPDHFDEGLGPITAMATAAAATEKLVVARGVVDLRKPMANKGRPRWLGASARAGRPRGPRGGEERARFPATPARR